MISITIPTQTIAERFELKTSKAPITQEVFNKLKDTGNDLPSPFQADSTIYTYQ